MVESRLKKLETGVIVLWSGYISAIPQGWQLCDGTNGTRDLRDRFVKGAKLDSEVGLVGGVQTHTHGTQPLTTSTVASTKKVGTSAIQAITDHSHTLTIPEASNEPPFYKLAYIQKM